MFPLNPAPSPLHQIHGAPLPVRCVPQNVLHMQPPLNNFHHAPAGPQYSGLQDGWSDMGLPQTSHVLCPILDL